MDLIEVVWGIKQTKVNGWILDINLQIYKVPRVYRHQIVRYTIFTKAGYVITSIFSSMIGGEVQEKLRDSNQIFILNDLWVTIIFLYEL
jgi:5-formaminoimidazole-4-carboxamide-1-beta-D-ribofuranosyl 5'-monophosphate synthetase